MRPSGSRTLAEPCTWMMNTSTGSRSQTIGSARPASALVSIAARAGQGMRLPSAARSAACSGPSGPDSASSTVSVTRSAGRDRIGAAKSADCVNEPSTAGSK